MKEQAEAARQLTIQAQTGYRGSGGIIFMPGVDVATEQRPQQTEPVTTGTKENVEGSVVKKSQSGQSSGNSTGTEEEKKEGTLTKEQEKELKRNRLAYELYEATARLATVESQMQQVSAGRMSLDQLEGCIRVVDRIKRKASKQRRMAAEDAGLAAGFANVFFRSVSCEKTLKDAYKKKGGNLGGLEHKIIEFFLGTEEENRKKLHGEPVAGTKEMRREKPPQEEVFANARIEDNNERIAQAEKALEEVRRKLGKKGQFSPEERSALIRAHEVGLGEGSVYNYEQVHITKKARILAEVFGKEERDLLMKKGYAGVAVPPREFATFDAARFAGTPLAPLAEELKNLGEGNFADQEGIEAIARKVAGVAGVTPAERTLLLLELQRFKGLAEGAEAAEDARRAAAGRGGRRGRDDYPVNEVKLELIDLEIPEIAHIKAAVEAAYTPGSLVAAQADELRAAFRAGIPKSKITEILNNLAGIVPTIRDGSPEELEARRLMSAVRELEKFIEARTSSEIAENVQLGLYRDIPLQKQDKEAIIEQALSDEGSIKMTELENRFNKYFLSADLDTNNDWREAMGQRKDFELQQFIDVLVDASTNNLLYITDRATGRTRLLTETEREKINKVQRRFVQQREARQYLHEIVRLVNTNADTSEMEKMSKRFTSEMSDTAYRMKGVTSASHFFENAMNQVMIEHGGYLPYEAMVNKSAGDLGEVERKVQDQMKKAYPYMEEWERNRAIAVARGMGIVSVRFIEIASQGQSADIPLVGWWANQIIKKYAYFRHVDRFNIGQERNTFMSYAIEDNKERSWWERNITRRFFASTDFEEGVKDRSSVARRKKMFAGQYDGEVFRFFDYVNIFNCGSLWTQTGWRWARSGINEAAAMADLLKHDPYNPLAGLGLWIERTKGGLSGHDSHNKVGREELDRLNAKFGVAPGEVDTEHKRAHFLIHKFLHLAGEVSPLKFMNNMPALRQAIIERYPDQEAFHKDLNNLSVFQEGLQRKRVEAFEKLQRGEIAHLDLYTEHADIVEYIEEEMRAGRIDHTEGESAITLAKRIQEEFFGRNGRPNRMNELVEDLEKRPYKVQFVLGTDDIALEKLSIVGTGPDTIKRRWEDMLASAGAAEQFGKLISGMSHYHKQEDIIKALNDVYSVLQGHDESVARVFMKQAMEGIIKYYKKDLMARLPFGVGSLYGLVKGRSSMAQKVYQDRGQMAWDELDIDAFIKKGHGLLNHEQEASLREKVGATNFNKVLAYARTFFMFALVGYIFYLMKKQSDEK